MGAGREERARGRSPMPEEEGSAAPVDAGDTAASWVMFGVGYPLSCAFVGLVTHRVALAYNPQSIKAAGGAITQLTCVASLSLKKPCHIPKLPPAAPRPPRAAHPRTPRTRASHRTAVLTPACRPPRRNQHAQIAGWVGIGGVGGIFTTLIGKTLLDGN